MTKYYLKSKSCFVGKYPLCEFPNIRNIMGLLMYSTHGMTHGQSVLTVT